MRMENTPLHSAAGSGATDLVRRLVAEGADLNAIGKGGWKPLLMAVYRGHTHVVRTLLEAGAQTNDGQNPLHFAAEYSYKNILELLLDYGANINTLDAKGRTALDLAGTEETVQYLRSRGAQSSAELRPG